MENDEVDFVTVPCHHLDDDVPASVQRSVCMWTESCQQRWLHDYETLDNSPNFIRESSHFVARTPQLTNARMHIQLMYTELTGAHWSAASKS
jgi:acyl carrier protein phosphodiesterase